MLLEIHDVLDKAQVAQMRDTLLAAPWVDGKLTAGHQSALAKHNRQLPQDAPAAQQCGQLILQALQRTPLFVSAALPQRVFPP